MTLKKNELNLEELASAPAIPATGKWSLYFKSDGPYFIDDAGNETGPLGEVDIAALINAATAKTTPASNDEFPLADSAASYALKKMTFSNLKLEIMKAMYPIGAVVTLGVSTNPATLFGFGTWTAIAGRVIVGIDAGQTEFDTLNETGGAKTHTLTESEMPSHTHVQNAHSHTTASRDTATAFGSVARVAQPSNSGSNSTVPTSSDTAVNQNAGGGGAHNNLQPYIVKYVWERTA